MTYPWMHPYPNYLRPPKISPHCNQTLSSFTVKSQNLSNLYPHASHSQNPTLTMTTKQAKPASFDEFNAAWLNELCTLVAQLSSAPSPPTTPDHHHILRALVRKVTDHFAYYYRTKSAVSNSDVLTIFASTSSTSLERSLHWVAGWRPTTLFHLLITESSSNFESRILDILRGVKVGDLGDLSPCQFGRISELQCETVREENGISEELGEWQEGMGELLEIACGGGCGEEWMRGVGGRMEKLGKVMEKADELRMRTLRSVVELLTPKQAAEFLIAAAELQFGIRAWGLNQDSRRGHA